MCFVRPISTAVRHLLERSNALPPALSRGREGNKSFRMFRLALRPSTSLPATARGLLRTSELAQRGVPSLSLSTKSSSLPSNTTTLKLLSLPNALTETKLKEALKGVVDARKIELEPGCAVHVLSEAEASHTINTLTKAKLDRVSASSCEVTNVALPSLLLENLPVNVSINALMESMKTLGLQPLAMHVSGCTALRASFHSGEEALRAAKMLRLLKKNGIAPIVNITSALDGSFTLTATPSKDGTSAETMLDAMKGAFPKVAVSQDPAAKRQLQLRYAPSVKTPTTNNEKLTENVRKAIQGVAGVQEVQLQANPLPRPAVLFHRTNRFDEASLVKRISAEPGAGLVTTTRRAFGAPADTIAVYFAQEEQAVAAAAKLRGATGLMGANGKTTDHKLSAVYRPLAVPTVKVAGLPKGATEMEISKLFKNFRPLAVHVKGDEALVTLNNPADVELACSALSRRPLRAGQSEVLTVTAAEHAGCDSAISVTIKADAPANTEALILQTLGGLNSQKALSPVSASRKTNVSVFTAFKTSEEALKAHEKFMKSSGEFATGNDTGLTITSKVSILPAYAVEVGGLGAETTTDAVLNALTGEGLVTPLGTDRSAILKFRRHFEIVPALNALKKKKLPGQETSLKVIRFRTDVRPGSNEYDLEESDEAQHLRHFDTFSLNAVLSDFMGADPGLRMQIAKSYFERALFDAKAKEDITFLLSTNVADSARDEALRLLRLPVQTKVSRQRLFELFVQRDDMQRFVADFNEMAAYLGDPNPNDPFDWSEFRLANGDDMRRLLDELAQRKQEQKDAKELANGTHVVLKDGEIDTKKEKKRLRKLAREKREHDDLFGVTEGEGEEGSSSSSDEDSDEDDDSSDMFVEHDLRLEDASKRIDRDGHTWSGAILNTDMVQKTMPGNRVSTHRALVVIGNMRGAAGFGMGKADSPALAVDAAFRDATRNLVHIDLFDNYGLAHDLHGKHNSCQAYIRATPKSRAMVGSPFARAILTRFGISSASCKVVGRRDPYAMCRAIFNAISKHENIDEFAKQRGQRYLTLRWIKKHGL